MASPHKDDPKTIIENDGNRNIATEMAKLLKGLRIHFKEEYEQESSFICKFFFGCYQRPLLQQKEKIEHASAVVSKYTNPNLPPINFEPIQEMKMIAAFCYSVRLTISHKQNISSINYFEGDGVDTPREGISGDIIKIIDQEMKEQKQETLQRVEEEKKIESKSEEESAEGGEIKLSEIDEDMNTIDLKDREKKDPIAKESAKENSENSLTLNSAKKCEKQIVIIIFLKIN